MILRTKLVLLLLWLTASVHCQPPPPAVGYQDLVAVARVVTPEAGAEDIEEADKQATMTTTTTPSNNILALAQLLPTILRPFLNNLGAGVTNALTATMMGRAIAFIPPEDVQPRPNQGR